MGFLTAAISFRACASCPFARVPICAHPDLYPVDPISLEAAEPPANCPLRKGSITISLRKEPTQSEA